MERSASLRQRRTIPFGGDVSSARSVNEGGAVEKPVPTNARQVYERSKHPQDWAGREAGPYECAAAVRAVQAWWRAPWIGPAED